MACGYGSADLNDLGDARRLWYDGSSHETVLACWQIPVHLFLGRIAPRMIDAPRSH